jgi:hypothetical protein
MTYLVLGAENIRSDGLIHSATGEKFIYIIIWSKHGGSKCDRHRCHMAREEAQRMS